MGVERGGPGQDRDLSLGMETACGKERVTHETEDEE